MAEAAIIEAQMQGVIDWIILGGAFFGALFTGALITYFYLKRGGKWKGN